MHLLHSLSPQSVQSLKVPPPDRRRALSVSVPCSPRPHSDESRIHPVFSSCEVKWWMRWMFWERPAGVAFLEPPCARPPTPSIQYARTLQRCSFHPWRSSPHTLLAVVVVVVVFSINHSVRSYSCRDVTKLTWSCSTYHMRIWSSSTTPFLNFAQLDAHVRAVSLVAKYHAREVF